MNKKAQATPLAFIFLIMVFVILWFLWLGNFVGEVGANMVATNNLTGVEAFAFSNLNLIIFIGLVLGTMAYLYYSGG